MDKKVWEGNKVQMLEQWIVWEVNRWMDKEKSPRDEDQWELETVALEKAHICGLIASLSLFKSSLPASLSCNE